MKLPGPSATEPNVYTFGTPYAVILDDLLRKDADLYTRNRLLQARPQPAAQHLAPLAWLEQHMPGLTPGLLPAHTRAEPCTASRAWLLCSTAGTCARRCCTATPA